MEQSSEQYGSLEPARTEDIPYDFDAEPVPASGEASLDEKWWETETACPPGSTKYGGLPPEHIRVGCKTDKGKNEGRMTRFHPGGQKAEEGQYKDHFAGGIWTEWDEQGRKLSETPYVAGKKQGLETIWYPGGEIKSQRPYKAGLRHGVVTIWDEQARKRTALTYEEGQEHGPEARWGIDGALARVIHWHHGVKKK